MRSRVLRGMLLVAAILALSGSASTAAPADPKPAAYPGAEDAGHIGCGEPALTQVSTADVR